MMKQGRRKRVLVVDDNRDAADTLVMLLQAEGCDAEAAYGGDQALSMAERTCPDVVVIDLFMPMMSGDELARRLRAGPRGDDMVLVAHTAMSSGLHHEAIVDAGFDHHLVKPAALDDLLALAADDPGALPALSGHSSPRWQRAQHSGHTA
ncbi:response regulator [Ideonella sp. BN130291]|uniref:response regulator n=1 Tax=Ideonella sp. BN130291 TaxID=3112940 RepID=UPI002E254368|nr:response regulator [Ideonella sp. BN130291]